MFPQKYDVGLPDGSARSVACCGDACPRNLAQLSVVLSIQQVFWMKEMPALWLKHGPKVLKDIVVCIVRMLSWCALSWPLPHNLWLAACKVYVFKLSKTNQIWNVFGSS